MVHSIIPAFNKQTNLCNVHDLNGGKLACLRVPTLKQKQNM